MCEQRYLTNFLEQVVAEGRHLSGVGYVLREGRVATEEIGYAIIGSPAVRYF
jgi:hypothetical protein